MTLHSFYAATAQDKEAALGREFRDVQVLSVDFGSAMRTTVILDGNRVVLVGDPREALRTYLGGKHAGEALQ